MPWPAAMIFWMDSSSPPFGPVVGSPKLNHSDQSQVIIPGQVGVSGLVVVDGVVFVGVVGTGVVVGVVVVVVVVVGEVVVEPITVEAGVEVGGTGVVVIEVVGEVVEG